MALRFSSRSRSAVPRIAALGAVLLALRQLSGGGPAYAVKGTWEGAPSTLKDVAQGDLASLIKGLEPQISLPAVTYSREGLALSVENGHLNADYTSTFGTDKTLKFHVDDAQAWRAGLSSGDASLRVQGQGPSLDDIFWEASQASSVQGVGDVKVEFNSDKAYNLTVARQRLADVAGVAVDASVRATNNGVTGRLDAQRQLPSNADLKYTVENQAGVYNLAKAKHVARVGVPLAGGDASLLVESEADNQRYSGSYTREIQGGKVDFKASMQDQELGYNVSYARGFGKDANVQLGVDEAGVYGKFVGHHDLGSGLDAEYEARARVGFGEEGKQEVAQALKVANKLGYAQLVHGTGQAPRLRVGYEFNA